MDGLEHGATDSGIAPRADFSTCAHPLGPCPTVLDAVLQADRSLYPDPSYLALRTRLAGFHDVRPDRVVVGAGASELVQRLVRAAPGDVLGWSPTFVEYHRAALQEGRRYLSAATESDWLSLVPSGGTAFLCQPNNPDGRVHAASFLEEASSRCRERGCLLVLDLAYREFLQEAPPVPAGAQLLWAPNKVVGLVGVRAGYLVASDRDVAHRLSRIGASWILSTEGVAFLEACRLPEASDWIRSRSVELESLATRMRGILQEAGWSRIPGSTHFSAHRPPGSGAGPVREAADWVRGLRDLGVRTRDLSNTGLPGWIRFSARPTPELDLLRDALLARR